jgi:FkbM family methyltransferase
MNNSLILNKFKDRIIFSNKAVWIENVKIPFYLGTRGGDRQGSSLLKKKRLSGKSIICEAFDFSQWLLSNFSKKDYIFLKMDIEGAEYEVLNKMIIDDSINLISELEVEFRAWKMEDKNTPKIHAKLKQKLNEYQKSTKCRFYKY